ncbi:MAG: hypothetical protein ABI600_14940 [Luteolibacter sp.]
MESRSKSSKFLGFFGFLIFLQNADSQVLYQSMGAVFAENFDGLPKIGTSFTWVDSSTLPGWYASSTVAAGFNPAAISAGSATGGNLYSFGLAGSSDRALGSLSSGAVGGLYYGTRIINQTGATIHKFTIRFKGEQWRSSGAAVQGMTFSYGLRATGLTQGTFVDVPSLQFNSPVSGGTAGSLNGNLTGTAFGPSLFGGFKWRHGEAMWLRWYDPDHPGTDHALAVDDFSFSADSLDSDNDLMEDSWEVLYQLNGSNPSDAVGDADGDGFTNQEEWWMGSNPRDPSSPPVIHVDKSSTNAQQLGTVTNPFKTIQSAINAADPNTIQAIMVNPGVYQERPYLTGKANIHIFSNNGPGSTTIDGQFIDSSVVRLYSFSKCTLSGFTIRNAQTAWSGGGVRVESGGGKVWISNNIISNNQSSNTDSSGGGGGIYLDAADDSMVINNIVFGNSARRGGAILFKNGAANFYHNTVVGNMANVAGLGGGLSAISEVVPDVKNNILWNNTGAAGYENLHQVSVSYCIVQSGASGVGNLASDPLFVNASNHDYHLLAGSPAIGAGYPLPVIEDFDGDLRAPAILSPRDIGADQFVANTSSLDSDGDGITDATELANGTNPTDYYNGAVPVLTVVSGDNQIINKSVVTPQAVVFSVKNGSGVNLANAPVTIAITSPVTNQGGLDSLSTGTFGVTSMNGVTNASGQIAVYYKSAATFSANTTITLSLRNTSVVATVSATVKSADSDNDGLLDSWEITYLGNLTQTGTGDYDGDGITNATEFTNGTNPTDYYNGAVPVLAEASGDNQIINKSAVTPQAVIFSVKNGSGMNLVNAPVTIAITSPATNQGALDSLPTGTFTDTSITGVTDASGQISVYYKSAATFSTNITITLSLRNTPVVARTSATAKPADRDDDGLLDSWEIQYFGDLSKTANDDPDSDGFTNYAEFLSGLNPLRAVPPISNFQEVTNPDGTVTYSWISFAETGDWFRIEREQPNGSWKPIYSTTYGSIKLPYIQGRQIYSLTLNPSTDLTL